MNFKDISTQYLINTFHLKRIHKNPILQEWLNMPYDIPKKIKVLSSDLSP